MSEGVIDTSPIQFIASGGGEEEKDESGYAWWVKALIALAVISTYVGLFTAHHFYKKRVLAPRWDTGRQQGTKLTLKPMRHVTLWVSLLLRGLILCVTIVVLIWMFVQKAMRRMWFDRLIIGFPPFMAFALLHCVVLDIHEALATDALQTATNHASLGAYSAYHLVVTLALGGALILLWFLGRGFSGGECEGVVTMTRKF